MYLSVFLNRFTDCHTMKNTERIMATIPINMENPQSLCRPHFMSISITFPELKFHVPLAPSKQWPSNSCKFIETGIKMKKDPRNDTKNAITWDKRSMFPIPMVVQILSVTFNASSFIPSLETSLTCPSFDQNIEEFHSCYFRLSTKMSLMSGDEAKEEIEEHQGKVTLSLQKQLKI